MSEEAVTQLLQESAFAFDGTVEQVGAATTGAVPVDEHTVVVHVDRVLHAPDAFGQLTGSRVTLQTKPDAAPPATGETHVFFANGLAFAESLALAEVGRLPVDAVAPHLTASAVAGSAHPLHDMHQQVIDARLRAHAADAAAIVLGRVVGLAKVTGPPVREHDPDWWVATVHAIHVEAGDVGAGDLAVLFANSLDVRWREVPKPKAAQNGLFILHATTGALTEIAPFQLQHPEDLQEPQAVESLRQVSG